MKVREGFANFLCHEHGFDVVRRDGNTSLYRKQVGRGYRYVKETTTGWHTAVSDGRQFMWEGPEFMDAKSAVVHAEIAQWGAA